jgi:hypothetical protein
MVGPTRRLPQSPRNRMLQHLVSRGGGWHESSQDEPLADHCTQVLSLHRRYVVTVTSTKWQAVPFCVCVAGVWWLFYHQLRSHGNRCHDKHVRRKTQRCAENPKNTAKNNTQFEPLTIYIYPNLWRLMTTTYRWWIWDVKLCVYGF